MTEFEDYSNSTSNSKATIGLIMGIISVLMLILSCGGLTLASILGILMGIAAAILGHITKKQLKGQEGVESQLKTAKAAFILGLVGAILGLIIFCALTVIFQMVLTGPALEGLFQDIVDQLSG